MMRPPPNPPKTTHQVYEWDPIFRADVYEWVGFWNVGPHMYKCGEFWNVGPHIRTTMTTHLPPPLHAPPSPTPNIRPEILGMPFYFSAGVFDEFYYYIFLMFSTIFFYMES